MSSAEGSLHFPPTSRAQLETELAAPRQLHPHPEGVFDEEQAFYGAFDPRLENIGRLTVVNTRFSGGRGWEDPLREHNLLTVDVDGYQHVVWVTEPLHHQDRTLNIVTKPGWGEVIEDGVGWQFHKGIAKRLPGARVISHATHGVGTHGEVVNWFDLPKHGINQMAEQGLELLQAYIPNQDVVFVGTSMGTVIDNRLLQRNLVSDNPLKVAGVINYAPALVDPSKVFKDMGLRFPIDMAKDGLGELFTRTEICHFIGMVMILGKSGMRPRDAITMLRQGVDLLSGTPFDDIEKVVAAYPTATIVGEKDPVGQVPMWLELKEIYPSLVLHILKNRGHGIAIKPIDGARKVSKTIVEMGLQPAFTTAA